MSLLFCDGFDHYETADLGTKGWTVNTSQSADVTVAAEGRAGGCLKWSVGAGSSLGTSWVAIASGAGTASGWCGFAVKIQNLANLASASVNNFLVGIGQASYAPFLYVNVSPAGVLSVNRIDTSDTSPTLLDTGSVAMSDNTWAYIECKWLIAASGTFVVRVNGQTSINFSGDTLTSKTADTTWDAIYLAGMTGPNNSTNYALRNPLSGSAFTVWIDDLVIGDLQGSVNNDLLGDQVVTTLVPSGAGTTTQWTPSAGSNYACVDDSVPDDDATYVSTDTTTEIDTYAVGDLTSTGTIHGVQVMAFARNESGTGTLRLVARSGTTEEASASDLSVDTSYSYKRAIWELDPDTDAAWSASGVNAAEFGIKKTA